MAYDLNDLVTVKQLKASAQKASDKADALEEKISNTLASVYKVKGTKAFSELTSALLIKANEGNVYNVSDAFTTTADFVEGVGKKYTAGSNVVIVEATAPVYTATEDTAVNAEHTYYEFRNGGYVLVSPDAEDNPSDKGWFELTTAGTYKFDVLPGDLANLQTLAVPAAANNIALLDATGQVIDSAVAIASDAEVNEMLAEVYGA